MEDFYKNEMQVEVFSNQETGSDTVSPGSIPGLSVIQDSTLIVPIDSALLVPSDSLFRFWQIKPAEKIFIGDSRFLPDTSYLEHISWKGLSVNIREKNYQTNDWFTIIMFLALVLLATVRAAYTKYIGTLFHSLINYTTSFRMFREKNYSFIHGGFRLEVLFYIVFSTFVFQLIVLSSSESLLFNWKVYGLTFGVLVVYFLGKKLAYKAFGSIFIGTSETSEFLFNMDNFNRGTGIVLFPIVALIAYFPFENPLVPVVSGVLTVVVFYVMLLKRGISILLKKQFPIFYLFLYLCTLEILPLLLIYKLVVD